MNYPDLKNEITQDPGGVGYSGNDAEAIAGLLNAENQIEIIDAEKDDVVRYLVRTDKWLAILDSAENAARSVMALAQTARFDVNGPAPTALIDGLVALELLDAGDKVAIQAMGQKAVSRASQIGLGAIRVQDVARVI